MESLEHYEREVGVVIVIETTMTLIIDDDDDVDQIRGAQKPTRKGMGGAGYTLDILRRPEPLESKSDFV